jgi:5'-deoxynucleotidase YfbR-like HD superfamily hydrolase
MESKRISISRKRQITIPQRFFETLGFHDAAECILRDSELVIRPVTDQGSGEFAEEILKDLIDQGYSGEELLTRFKEQRIKLRPAVERMIEEADTLADDKSGTTTVN